MLNFMLYIFCQLYFAIRLAFVIFFQNIFAYFFQKRIFSTYFASFIFGNMHNALLVLQIIADIFLRASKNEPYF